MSNPLHIPSIYAGILFQSRLNPHATAVIHGSRTMNYRVFCGHVENVTRRLHSAGIPSGTRVGVNVQEPYLRWLAVLALARMGAVSVSLGGHPGEPDFLKAELILHDGTESPGRRNIRIEEEWSTSSADYLPRFQDRLHDPEEPCRIVLSSGTTGLPKKALFTCGHLRARSRGAARQFGLNAAARVLTTMSITTIGGFWTPVQVWSNGGAVILTQPKAGQGWARVVVQSKPNVLFTSTAQLGSIVASLPADFYAMPDLAAYVAGSALPLAVNRKARLRLTQTLFSLYGSTEAGTTALVHASMADSRPELTGYVVPAAQVEVVDEQGQPVPNGTMGEIRIRAEGLVDEYLEDTAANDGSFRDGWFHPGDAGTLDDEGGLSVLGRTRELMNFGGVKIAPDSIEAELAKAPGVTDLAVFALEGRGGNPRPFAAVVAGEDFDDAALANRFARVWKQLPAITVVRVPAIPRNEMGKVMRAQLATSVQEAQESAPAALAASRPR
jgi:acyl-coenzyme A synthetase/AMP-(fatty) acid ligase